MKTVHRARRTRCLAVAFAASTSVLVAACGEEETYKNEPRPPAPIVITASIASDSVSVSPRTFGAGPITLIVTNQTERAQELTLETDEIGGSEPGLEQNSGPINPGDTASLKADLRSGTYKIAVDGDGISGASLKVGDERESAQDDLLQP